MSPFMKVPSSIWCMGRPLVPLSFLGVLSLLGDLQHLVQSVGLAQGWGLSRPCSPERRPALRHVSPQCLPYNDAQWGGIRSGILGK